MKRQITLLVLALLPVLLGPGCAALERRPCVATVGGDYESAYVGLGTPAGAAAEVGARLYWWEQLPRETVGLAAYGRLDVGPPVETPLDPFGSGETVTAQGFIDGEIGATERGGDVFTGLGGGLRFAPFALRYVYGDFRHGIGRDEGYNPEQRLLLEVCLPLGGPTR